MTAKQTQRLLRGTLIALIMTIILILLISSKLSIALSKEQKNTADAKGDDSMAKEKEDNSDDDWKSIREILDFERDHDVTRKHGVCCSLLETENSEDDWKKITELLAKAYDDFKFSIWDGDFNVSAAMLGFERALNIAKKHCGCDS